MLPGYWLGKLRLPGVVGPHRTSLQSWRHQYNRRCRRSIPCIGRGSPQGAAQNNEATDYPIPSKTGTDGSAQADDFAEQTEERKAVQIQRAATDLFNARQPLQFTTRDVEFTKAADTQYITRGGDGAPEQPGAPANAEAPASNKPVSLAKRARTCFLTAARPRR
jgi:hypothetical protein